MLIFFQNNRIFSAILKLIVTGKIFQFHYQTGNTAVILNEISFLHNFIFNFHLAFNIFNILQGENSVQIFDC